MPELTVKLDSIALLRESRKTRYPDPVTAAAMAELAGADRIAVHLSQKRRIPDRDVRILRSTVQTELSLEMVLCAESVGLALDLSPNRIVFVAENPKTGAIEQGMDLFNQKEAVAEAVMSLKKAGITVCLSLDPEPEQIRLAHRANVAVVQFHTGAFCSAATTLKRNRAYMKLVDAVNLARKLKMGVSLGHGLCYQTVKAFSDLRAVNEFCIGHSIVSRAVLVGMDRAVRDMLAAIAGRLA